MPTSRAHRGKLLRISSEDKNSGTNGSFTLSLGNSAFVQNVKGIAVKSVSFKHIFPNIFIGSDGIGNTLFTLAYAGVPYEVFVEPGWWDSASLAAELTSLITAAVPGVVTVSLVVSPAGAPAAQNTYFNFASDAELDLYSRESAVSPNPMAEQVGISEDVTIPAAGNYTAPWLPQLSGLTTVYLCSNAFAASNSSASSNDGEIVPIVTEVPITVPFGGEILYRPNDADLNTIMFQNAKSLNSVDLAICTRSGTVLDLQQNDLTCTFRIIPQGAYATD